MCKNPIFVCIRSNRKNRHSTSVAIGPKPTGGHEPQIRLRPAKTQQDFSS